MDSEPPRRPRTSLAERAGVETEERRDRWAAVVADVDARRLHSVRLSFTDPHGLLRSKSLRADELAGAFENGLGITSALLMKDTGQLNVYPVWAPGGGLGKPWLTGAGDVIMLPDPTTFRVLPWVEGTGWLACDLFAPDGEPVSLSTRRICAEAERAVTEAGHRFTAGLEIEFHLYRVVGDGPVDADGSLAPTHPGRVYLGEVRFDGIEPFLDVLRRDLTTLGLPPRTLEIELGPSQAELTFSPGGGLQVADEAVLIRSAIKQIARRHGLHATFMGRPAFADSFTSGWHLHQSLADPATGANRFATDPAAEANRPGASPLSGIGEQWVAGLLAHAAESCLLTTPTVTGYKRYRPQSLAPDRIAWGTQHRGAMLRIVGAAGDPATRVENRVGDSAANPYLYVASQLVSGLAGIEAGEGPPPITESPYEPDAGPRLPRTLGDAIDAFDASARYRAVLGDEVVDYLVTLKRAEWDRFLSTVTDWEQREYLELF